jgi:hypothetical protein
MPVAASVELSFLDGPTVAFVAVCVIALLGLLLILAWLQHRDARALAAARDPREHAEYFIADRMAETVIDRLETIEPTWWSLTICSTIKAVPTA